MGLDGLKWVSICKNMGLDGFGMSFNMENIWVLMGLDGLKWVSICKTYFNGSRWTEMGFNMGKKWV